MPTSIPVQGTQHRLARQGGAGLLALTAVIALLVLPVSPAAAHNSVVSTVPAEGSTITEKPEAIRVTTSDTLIASESGTVIQISGPDGAAQYYGDGCVQVAGASAETTAMLGAAGEYTVNWRVVSTDGHPTTGSFAFQWQPAEGVELADGAASPPTCGSPLASSSSPDTPDVRDADSSPGSAGMLTDVAWIGGALLAVLAAVAATMALVRRRSTSEPDDDEHPTR